MSYVSAHPAWAPICAMCNCPVPFETCKADERGRAVHEECYVRKTRIKARRVPIPPLVVEIPPVRFMLLSPRAETMLSSRSCRPLTHFALGRYEAGS